MAGVHQGGVDVRVQIGDVRDAAPGRQYRRQRVLDQILGDLGVAAEQVRRAQESVAPDPDVRVEGGGNLVVQ
jgi:hypothetical protein